jgi:AcrR family transcriptional regulator
MAVLAVRDAPACYTDGMATPASPEPTRRRILDAAKSLFEANGIRGTSLEQVAEAAGVHRVTVHRAFAGGRDELVAEVLVARALEVLAQALPLVDDSRPVPELVVEAFTSFVVLARSDPLIYEGICSDAAALALNPDRLGPLYEMTLAWDARIAPTAQRDHLAFVNDPRRVTDLLARTVFTLVREPGIVATEDDVRAYLRDFIVPAITRPVAGR